MALQKKQRTQLEQLRKTQNVGGELTGRQTQRLDFLQNQKQQQKIQAQQRARMPSGGGMPQADMSDMFQPRPQEQEAIDAAGQAADTASVQGHADFPQYAPNESTPAREFMGNPNPIPQNIGNLVPRRMGDDTMFKSNYSRWANQPMTMGTYNKMMQGNGFQGPQNTGQTPAPASNPTLDAAFNQLKPAVQPMPRPYPGNMNQFQAKPGVHYLQTQQGQNALRKM